MLSHLRLSPELSRGRRYPEPQHPYRNDFQRDRDRVIHSRAFRRLEHKTQVYTAPLSDHFRNRLTHSIEVAQIARTVARALELDEDLVEALSLAHDLGHPPFGHAGEQVLDEEMRRFGGRFDHNIQGLRVVEEFEQRYAAFPGLNLTFEVREGLAKHSQDIDLANYPDLEQYLPDRQPPLEAQIIDPADEIAYNCADLDDAVEAKALDPDEARAASPLFDQAWRAAAATYPSAGRWKTFNEALRRLIEELVFGLIDGTRRSVEAAGAETVDDVRALPYRLARPRAGEAEASRCLKALLSEKVYRSAALERESVHAREKVQQVFRHYMSHPERLPRTQREQTESKPLHRLVCDYVAGMTDKFLLRRHAEIFGQ